MTNAGITLTLLGHYEDAWSVFDRTLSFTPNPTQRRVLFTYLAVGSRQTGASVNEERWANELRKVAPNDDVLRFDSGSLYYLARRAMDLGEWSEAAEIIEVLNSRTKTRSRSAYWGTLNALNLRLANGVGRRDIAAKWVDDIAEWSIRTAPRAQEDDVALALVGAYSQVSTDLATDYLHQYVQLRRSGVPVLPLLSNVAKVLLG